MNNRFVYDEKTSSLYAPDGVFLKRLHCPKAMHWNQLVVDESEQRWRNCHQCKERVLNLDVADVELVVRELQSQSSETCIHVSSSSDRVIFLKDSKAPPRPNELAGQGTPVIIQTARTLLDIDRAVGMGYWPDVRMVKYDAEKIHAKVAVGQNPVTGAIKISRDLRRKFRASNSPDSVGLDDETDSRNFTESIPFTEFYQYFQDSPVAAYLIPKSLQEGAAVIAPDPIEDIVGTSSNQGNAYRATDVPGVLKNRKIVLDNTKVTVSHWVG